ncbi:chemotaxis protein CheW [Marinococcus sp. PL1-022]|jgi:purine-binding chemotaxis protein CheW|uniref:chemotaxis protein CheW n=1 Tax=Marinococcus sp. PL1-022 TaxID=3095363 RepID=UPI002634BC4D|nr:chemotaxis protein CheW [Marinococcus sp. PL1-022]MDX6152102.1 chemotaxis protein CheW [Marinococcus sp. PL1-022]
MTEENAVKKVIIFRLAAEEYGVEVNHVQSIERMQNFTRIPNAEKSIRGVINLRGVIIPIIDLRKRLSYEEVPYTEETRILILALEGNHAGLIVDAANDVIDVFESEIGAPPQAASKEEQMYLKNMIKKESRVFTLLNVHAVAEALETSSV